jgi:hypothetical protein
MNKAQITRLVRGTYEHWNGEGSWEKASSWRKSDWRGMVMGIIEEALTPSVKPQRPMLPSEMPMPPLPPLRHRPYRADATDDNPEG